jgi:hypothetical protein
VNYYSGLAGVTVNAFAAPVTPALLAGMDLFIAFLPDLPFSAGEVAAIGAFWHGGGNLLFTGEWNGFDPAAIANINAILASLGSPLAIAPANLDLQTLVASGAQIASDPLTAGVARFSYAATSAVTGGTPLFFTTGGSPFVAYSNQVVPEPSALLLFGGVAGFLALRRFRR